MHPFSLGLHLMLTRMGSRRTESGFAQSLFGGLPDQTQGPAELFVLSDFIQLANRRVSEP